MLYNRIPSEVHVELTDICNAACPLCPRTDPETAGTTPLVLNVKLNIDLLIYRICQETSINRVRFCGNFGDPISHPELIVAVEHLIKAGKLVLIHTNGGLKSIKWWAKLATIMGNNGVVTFGIDGTSKQTHEQYRVHTDFDKVINNAKSFISAGGIAQWQFLEFEHNGHEIDNAKLLAKEYGFKGVKFIQTNRFKKNITIKVINRKGAINTISNRNKLTTPIEKVSPNKVISQLVVPEIKHNINCEVVSNGSVYIDSEGYVFPCCWTASFYRGQKVGIKSIDTVSYDWSDENHIQHNSLSNIILNDFFTNIRDSFDKYPLRRCSEECGSNVLGHTVDRDKMTDRIQF